MPRAGLAEPARELLRAAVADDQTVARFRYKIVQVPGVACELSRASAGRGYGRISLGTVAGRDVVVIAHRSHSYCSTASTRWNERRYSDIAATTHYANGSGPDTSTRPAPGAIDTSG